jgi:hypothetical protein
MLPLALCQPAVKFAHFFTSSSEFIRARQTQEGQALQFPEQAGANFLGEISF